jgi:hypothetical protein
MKVHIKGQKFQTDDELEHSVLNWLCKQDKTCQNSWKKYVSVKGEYLKKE